MPAAGSRLALIQREVSALRRVLDELRDLAAATTDLQTSADLRQRDAEISEQLELLRMKRDRAAATGVVAPLTPDERRRQIEALSKLDAYVRNDQDVQTSIRFLLQIAACLT